MFWLVFMLNINALHECQLASNAKANKCSPLGKKQAAAPALYQNVDHGPTIGPAAPMGGDCRHGGLNTPESYL